MKYLLFFLLASCSPVVTQATTEKEKPKFFLARITFYTDCPTYGKKTASTRIAEEGTTVAAHKKVPFGEKYYIPRLKEWMKTDGVFRVDDRGGAVNSRKASGGKLPVIDIYVDSRAKVRKLGGRSNNVFKVYER